MNTNGSMPDRNPTLDDLASLSRFVVWRNEMRGTPPAPTKIPYNPRKTSQKAMANNPATWAPRQEAQAAVSSVVNGMGGGIGIELGDLGDGRAIGGIDLDTCRRPDGALESWAVNVLERFGTYAEISPSLTGVKLLFTWNPADADTLKSAMGGQLGRAWKRGNGSKHPPAIELYLAGRYFAITDERLPDAPANLMVAPTALLMELVKTIGPAFVGEDAKASAKGRSEKAFAKGAMLRRRNATYDEMVTALLSDPDPDVATWAREKGQASGGRQFRRIWDKAEPDAEPDAPKRKRSLNALALVNFMAAEPEWKQALRINLFNETMEVSDQFPPAGKCSATYRPFREPGDLLEAMLWFQGSGFAKAGKAMVWDALTASAHRNAYHPVRDYLACLKWDGKERLGRLFQHYFNGDTHDGEDATIAYLEHTSQCFMVSAVARIHEPGCKVDYLPVLVGSQGHHKSQAIRALCRDSVWFSDDLSPDLVERDTKESLVGKWLIELAELPHVRKEVERVKAFFSRQTDRYRRAYDRTTNDWPRQCVFMGSTNDLEFIDVTGNRRFWPVEVSAPIDVARIIADRDQLWAEAVAIYKDGFQWWLRPAIEALAAEQQAQFAEEDIWASVIGTWAAQQTGPFTLADAMTRALPFVDPKLITKTEQMRASACLKGLGYRRRKQRKEGSPQWLWRRERAGTGGDKGGDGGNRNS